MKELLDPQYRTLTDAELLSIVSDSKVNYEQSRTLEEYLEQLTPARKKVAFSLLELQRRFQNNRKDAKVMRCSANLYDLFCPLVNDIQVEEFWVCFLNQASKVIRLKRLSVGGLSAVAVDIRLILKEAILCNATTIAVCHNHPSGSILPSREDDRITDQLNQAGKLMNIRMIDHIIIGLSSYYSYADEGRI